MNMKTNAMLPEIPKEVGKTSDGRIIYETKYLKTGSTMKFTIPENNQDKFEKLVRDIHKKYDKYGENPSKKFKKALHTTTLIGAILGGILTASFIKTKSKIGKLAKIFSGTLGGAVVSSIILASSILYPMVKYTNEIKNMGYKSFEDHKMVNESKDEVKPYTTEKK